MCVCVFLADANADSATGTYDATSEPVRNDVFMGHHVSMNGKSANVGVHTKKT